MYYKKVLFACTLIFFCLVIMLCLNWKLRHSAESKKIEPTHNTITSCGGTYINIEENGTVVIWGEGLAPFTEKQTIPFSERLPIFEGATSIYGGRFNVLVVDKDNNLWSLYDSFASEAEFIVEKQGQWTKLLSNVSQASAGLHHGVAVLTNGEIWTWGANDKGQLGVGTSNPGNPMSFRPKHVFNDAKYVYADTNTSFIVTQDGDLFGWGYGISDGVPTLLGNNIASITKGPGSYVQILNSAGEIYFWDTVSYTADGIGPLATNVIKLFDEAFLTQQGEFRMWENLGSNRVENMVSYALPEHIRIGHASIMGYFVKLEDGSLCVVENQTAGFKLHSFND